MPYKNPEDLVKHRSKPDFKIQTREGHLRRRFGMTIADYDSMLEKQGNVCAICKKRRNYKT